MANQTFASLLISSEVVSGQQIAEVLHLRPTRIFVKGTPTGQTDCQEHPFHIAMFASSLEEDQHLDAHLAAVLQICEGRRESLVALKENCTVHVHCMYVTDESGGWTLNQDLCRRMASLPLEYVFAVDVAGDTRGPSRD